MKAVLFYRIAQFVYWPGNQPAPTPLVLCVAGKSPFGPALGQLPVPAGGIDIRYGITDPAPCHLLFIARSESANVAAWLNRTEGRPTITVSDIPGFARGGGMVELPLEGERVSLVVNRKAAQKQGIEFNAQLLRLARVVEP